MSIEKLKNFRSFDRNLVLNQAKKLADKTSSSWVICRDKGEYFIFGKVEKGKGWYDYPSFYQYVHPRHDISKLGVIDETKLNVFEVEICDGDNCGGTVYNILLVANSLEEAKATLKDYVVESATSYDWSLNTKVKPVVNKPGILSRFEFDFG